MPCQKNNTALFRKVTKKLRGNESGVSMLETLVALAILGLVAVVFLGGLTGVARATLISDEQATAESLARSQIELVKSQVYINYAVLDHEEYVGLELEKVPASYSVEITAVPINPDTGQPLPSGQDNDIQKITVTVNRNDEPVLTVEDYKVNR